MHALAPMCLVLSRCEYILYTTLVLLALPVRGERRVVLVVDGGRGEEQMIYYHTEGIVYILHG